MALATTRPNHTTKQIHSTSIYTNPTQQGIAALMASDMVAAARCFRVVAWLNSDFALLLHLLEAWAEEIERELDFRVGGCVVCPYSKGPEPQMEKGGSKSRLPFGGEDMNIHT